ncbi:hypothetical protein EVAR_61655_1 [Eumeta japonica]|uniref:Uncharacterized protein n=1 Tax=Eumeta variegata TaxID=151549 RepID=A0A4C1Z765_EUMVA|nr:hypothetical protein EVAR_61655_1 [Eumeta japonica]
MVDSVSKLRTSSGSARCRASRCAGAAPGTGTDEAKAARNSTVGRYTPAVGSREHILTVAAAEVGGSPKLRSFRVLHEALEIPRSVATGVRPVFDTDLSKEKDLPIAPSFSSRT